MSTCEPGALVCRLFLKKLKETLQIPVLALVDSDPYGLKILSVYMKGARPYCRAERHWHCSWHCLRLLHCSWHYLRLPQAVSDNASCSALSLQRSLAAWMLCTDRQAADSSLCSQQHCCRQLPCTHFCKLSSLYSSV